MSEQKKLLLVEDNKANTALMSKQLSMLGVEVTIADNGQAALDRLNHEKFDLVVTDCNMPVMDGYEMARQIRQREQEQHADRLGIIAITADALDGTAEKCYEAGMDEYITKPVEVSTWKEIIANWLKVGVDADKPEEGAASSDSENTVNDDLIRKSALVDLLGIDEPEILAEYYTSFTESGDEIMQDLKKYYAEQNWIEVGNNGHKMKSSARAIGADALADTCMALEHAGRQENIDEVHKHMAVIEGQYQAVSDWINDYSKDFV